ncbi:hypothetical protein NLU13_0012 [Sarocladium strictum]|uniref:Ricin B lectin n=1 Tax=Sarocladium strictum TaxID=5046 RepID=A0AA39GPR3_SARSR|nr:hypothetical protein NLU13_0012 [Sarocladium strictum]
MHLAAILITYTSLVSATLTWTLSKASNPTADQIDAYARIEAAMTAAVNRYNRLGDAQQTIRVRYDPGIPTAEANVNGDLGFGSNRSYMSERTALHEISHTLGLGLSGGWYSNCGSGNWPTALPLLRSWDGPGAVINCGGSHIWPYGLNYDNEWSDQNAERHCLLVNAMIDDGM